MFALVLTVTPPPRVSREMWCHLLPQTTPCTLAWMRCSLHEDNSTGSPLAHLGPLPWASVVAFPLVVVVLRVLARVWAHMPRECQGQGHQAAA